MKPEDLTVTFVEDGKDKVREIDKIILSSSASWVTIAFLFSEADAEGGWRPHKVGLRRYRKRGGRFVVDKHFVLSSARQAHELQRALARWFVDAPAATSEAIDDDD